MGIFFRNLSRLLTGNWTISLSPTMRLTDRGLVEGVDVGIRIEIENRVHFWILEGAYRFALGPLPFNGRVLRRRFQLMPSFFVHEKDVLFLIE